MAGNHVLLETIELTQSAASVTFDNIPPTGYTDLKIVASARSTANGGQNMNLTFNSTTSGYSDKILSGNGSSPASFTSGNTSRGGSCVIPGADFTANTFGNGEILIPNYTGSSAKSFSSDSVTENNTTLSYLQMQATLWNNTAAINTILINLSGGSFASGSTFSLYGVADVNTTPVTAPLATGGNIVANDGTYWYHAFLSSGNFVPQTSLTCDALVIAGGGAGSGNRAGGGGAGGLLTFSSQSLTSINYAVTVGSGGAGATAGTQDVGTSGTNSQFSSLTASVGGGAGGNWVLDGTNGGSGGGGGGAANPPRSTAMPGGSATSGQGNAGGNGFTGVEPSTYGKAGGGGGAGAVGTNATSTLAGAGGAGVNTYSSWATATSTGVSGFYAGGGGGGADLRSGSNGSAGSGGAGAGGGINNGVASTGSGGGGGSYTGSSFTGSGSGGSGIVIIRYAMV